MAKMVNVSGETVTITIQHGPGQQPQVITVQPHGEGEFPDGYCEPVKGAGRHFLHPIISQKSMKFGVPRLVRPELADESRARWERASGQRAAPAAVAPKAPEEPAPIPPRPEAEAPAAAPTEAPQEVTATDHGEELAEATTPKVAQPVRRRRKR